MDSIQINNVQYPVKYGLSVVRRFAEQKGFTGLEQFEAWYQTITQGKPEGIKEMAELLLMGIQRGCQKEKTVCDLDVDDIIDLMLEDKAAFNGLVLLLSKSMESGAMAEPTDEVEGTGEDKKKGR